MAVAALSGFALLIAMAFGLRTLLHLRRTGTTGWLASPTPAARVGDGLFTVGLAGTILAPVLDLLDLVDAIEVADTAAVNIVGATLLTVGSVVALVAQAQMGKAWRAGIDLSEQYPLVTSGLFSVVRNPFYLGFITASAGVALMVPNVWALAGWAALVAGCEIDVRLVEEPHLRAVHADYVDYAASTPRFIPVLRRPWFRRRR